MSKVLLLIFLSISLFSCSQVLKCNNFRNGNFIVPNDAIGTKPYRIIRNDTTQVEIDSKGVKRYSKLKWLNDCSYIIFYDNSKETLTDFQKEVNDIGGIIVEVTKVEGKCFYFTSNIKGDDKSQSIEGVICKEQ